MGGKCFYINCDEISGNFAGTSPLDNKEGAVDSTYLP